MNKRNLVALMLVALLVGTGVFAQTSLRLGGGYVYLVDDANKDLSYSGFEGTARIWFSELPQLTVTGSYTMLEGKEKDVDTKFPSLSDFAVVGEYRVYNETNYGFSLNGGYLNKGVTGTADEAEREAESYLTVGGKGNYVLMDGLQAVAGASYAFNNLFKEEAADEASILSVKAGLEYDLEQVPGLKLGAYYLRNQKTVGDDEDVNNGFNVAASYAFSF